MAVFKVARHREAVASWRPESATNVPAKGLPGVVYLTLAMTGYNRGKWEFREAK